MREDVVDILPNSNVQLATMDAKQTNSCKYRKSMGYAPQRLNSHHLSRTQSGLSEPEVRQSTPPDHPNITRRHSLSMPSDQSCPVVLSLRRKPNFTIRFPALRISPPVSAIKGVSRQRLSPAASATVADLDAVCIGPISPSPEPKPLPTFIPAPLTPPDEIVDSFISPEDSTRGTLSVTQSSSDVLPSMSGISSSLGASQSSQQEASTPAMETPASVFDEAISSAIIAVASSSVSQTSLKIVYQALPCPISEYQGVSAATAYTPLIEAIQEEAALPARYIHVVHALPEKYLTDSLPTSPLVTPSVTSRSSSQQGYFDYRPRQVISNAVIMVDRYQPRTESSASVPMSPGLALPPEEASISLYERIIPPRTSDEVLDFFEPSGRSPLIDRIRELAPSGTLILIHPTQAGGRAFEANYLGPVLEPVIRNIQNKYSLPHAMCRSLGSMGATRYLRPFEEMRTKLRSMLNHMDREKYGDAEANFSILQASTAKVQVTRKVWERWWVHQEKPRIEKVMSEYYASGRGSPSSKVTAATVARELIESLEKRGYRNDEHNGEGDGIELGLFVIKRTA